MTGLSVRPMARPELDLAIEWAASEGWNPGYDDGDAFYAADAEGFLMGFVDKEPATSISVVTYGPDYGFLGFHICRPELRGHGYGFETWRAGMARLEHRVVGLDGAVDQQANYAKSGFVFAHRNIRYGGPATVHETADTHIVELWPTGQVGLAGSIVEYDKAFFPAPRKAFARAWIAPPGRRTVAFIRDDRIRGYGSVRACREGHKIGPLFADDEKVADRIFGALAGRLHGTDIFLDVPESNGAAAALAERYALKPVFETARMYRGPAPDLPLDRIFGITTFELG